MLTATIVVALAASAALAEKKYAPGVSESEIKIGQTDSGRCGAVPTACGA
jgi:hypothetical protein